MASFAKNNIVKSPDIAPPPPVLRNVGHAAFMDALSIASSVASIATGVGSLGQAGFLGGGTSGGLTSGNQFIGTSQGFPTNLQPGWWKS